MVEKVQDGPETETTNKRHLFTYSKDNSIREGDLIAIVDGIDLLKQIKMKHGEYF